MPAPGDEQDWYQYRRLILSRLDDLGKSIDEVNVKIDAMHRDEITRLKVDVAMLQVKAGIWGGGIGGLSGVAAAIGTMLLVASKGG